MTILTGVIYMTALTDSVHAREGIREPAVAGSFYERNPALLREVVLRYLAEGKVLDEPVRFLICPHAGYVFSGPVAGRGYATLDTGVKRVIILGPSHYKAFAGMAVPQFSQYKTPLGTVPVDRAVVDKLKNDHGVIEAEGFDEPEHCLEVQLPFLQVRLHDFMLVPIICGRCDPAEVAAELIPFIDEKTAVIASSDLSHYQTQAVAEKLDEMTVKTILSAKADGKLDACGEMPIRIMMNIARHFNREAVLVDARTSFDTAPDHCPENRVVGYAAIAYLSPEAATRYRPEVSDTELKKEEHAEESFTEQQQRLLLDIARAGLEASVRGEKYTPPADIPALLRENRGCFVTLTAGGALRGCIGYIEPIKPLFQAVAENAKNAALSDPRFPRVTPAELSRITVEVSVLTKPEVLEHDGAADLLAKLVPERDGVILSDGMHQSTYLPQVWEQLPGKVAFLEQLSLKAHMSKDWWKHAEVKTYRAEHFSE